MTERSLILMLSAGLVLGCAVPAGAEGDELQTIGPPDCFVLVEQVRGEIDLIRIEMGRAEASRHAFDLVGTEPREVYFQAITLLKKTDRLCFQINRESLPLSERHADVIDPSHVYHVVQAALKRLQHVKTKLRIPEKARRIARDESKSPSDVFQSVVQASHQLNLLLDRPFSASDNFQQVTLALHHATRLRARFPGARIPETPQLERRKRPDEVFQRLMRCHEQVRRIAEVSGVPMATLRHNTGDGSIRSGEIYDLASLVVSELAFLNVMLTGEQPPDESYPPGQILPSQVFQRVGLLQAQLEELEGHVRRNPSWLREARPAR